MPGEVLIDVENVSKKFCRSLKRSLWYGVKDIASELTGRSGHHDQLRKGEFWAVKDVSFQVRRGECLGLIGRNGAGKTTLLRMLNGLIKPDQGKITMRGRVGALIALGAGFIPILTGRENVYAAGAVLGLTTKEIDAKYDDIVEFAEMEEFMETPVQTYSSGMQVRLGFAVATALKPDVLLLDEVLAVGDAAFRHKCYHRINKLMSSAAVIMVSHSMDYIVQISTQVAMMRRGVAELFDDPIEGIAAYNDDNTASNVDWRDGGKVEAVYPPVRKAEVRINNPQVRYGECLTVEVDIECTADVSDVVFSFTAVNTSEQPVMCWHTSRYPQRLSLQRGCQRLRLKINPLLLNNGDYHWNLNVAHRGSIENIIWFMRAGRFTVVSDFRPLGNIPYIADTSDFELTPLSLPEMTTSSHWRIAAISG